MPSRTRWVPRMLRRRKRIVQKQQRRRHFAEHLEARRLLAADAEGDSIAAAYVVSLTANTMHEHSATIGDGNYGSKDVDFYRLDLSNGQTVDIDIDGSYFDDGTSGGLSNSYLRVFDVSGAQLQSNNSGSAPNDFFYATYDSFLSFTAPASASYFVGVSSAYNTSYNPAYGGSGSYGPGGSYRLQLLTDGTSASSLSVGDVTVSEDAGTASFQITLSQALSNSVTLDYATADSTATQPGDYTSTSGSLTFAAGETSKTVQVPVINDTDTESDEMFDLVVSNVVGVSVDDATGTATIQANDALPIDQPGDELPDALVLSPQPTVPFEIEEAIGDGNYADRDVDLFQISLYEGQSINIDVDAQYYDDQTIGGLSNSYLRVFDSSGTELASNNNASAVNDYYAAYNDSYLEFTALTTGTYYFGVSSYYNSTYDPTTEGTGSPGSTGDYKVQLLLGEVPGPTLTVGNVTVSEDAHSAIFMVSLSETSDDSVTFDYATESDTAESNVDFDATSGLLYFSPGQTSKTVEVPLIDDGVSESSESFRLQISNVYGAAVGNSFATATINDDDPLPQDLVGDTTTGSYFVSFDANGDFDFDGYAGNGSNGIGDIDLFQFSLSPGQQIVADIDTVGIGLDSYLRLFNSSGTELASNDNEEAGTTDSLLQFVASTPGTYYLGVTTVGNETYNPTSSAPNSSGATTGPYSLSLSKSTYVDTPMIDLSISDAPVVEGQMFDLGAFPVGSTPYREVRLDNTAANSVTLVEPINLPSSIFLVESFGSTTLLASDAIEEGPDVTTFAIQPDTSTVGDVTAQISFDAGTGPSTIAFSVTFSVYQPETGDAVTGPISVRSRLDRYTTYNDETLIVADPGFLANDIDAEGDPLKAEIITQPRFGTLVANTLGGFEYTPYPDFVGIDTFRYRAFDDSDAGAIQYGSPISVSIDVSGDRPTLLDIADRPKTIHINTSTDVIDPNDGILTFREAIAEVNSSANGKTIFTFGEDVSSIQLLNGEILVDADIEIDGGTDGIEFWTEGDFRLFEIADTANVSLLDVELAGRQLSGQASRIATNLSGGAIYNSGTLELERVYIHGHTLLGSQERRGGAIYNANGASLSIRDSTISDNFAGMDGGAIYNALSGNLSLLNTTISANTSAIWGGGIYSVGTSEILSSTIVENEASAGANIAVLGTLSTANTIFASGIESADVEGQVSSLGGNLVGDNTDSTGFSTALGDQYGDNLSPLDPVLGPLQLNGGIVPTHMPLVGSPVIDRGINVYSHADQRGGIRVADGLEATALLDTDSVIDVGAVEFGTFFVNVLDDRVDQTPLGDGRVDVDPSTPGDQISLRAAVQEHAAMAGSFAEAGSITGAYQAEILFEGTADLEVPLDLRGADEERSQSGDLDLYGNINIRGSLISDQGRSVTIQGTWQDVMLGSFNHDRASFDGFDRVFHGHPNAEVELASLKIADGVAMFGDGEAGGGGIFNDQATIFVVDTVVTDNFADFGGGIYSRDGLTVLEQGSIIQSNFAADGAGVYLEAGTLTVLGSSLEHNLYARYGGATFVESGNAYFGDNTNIERNELQAQSESDGTKIITVQDGAAIYLGGGAATIDQAVIHANGGMSTYTYTGADIVAHYTERVEDAFYQSSEILVDEGVRLDIYDSEFRDQYDIRFLNSSGMIDSYFAPMVILNSGTANVTGSLFTSNERLFANLRSGEMTIVDSDFHDNRTQRYLRSATGHMPLPSYNGLAGPGGTVAEDDARFRFPYAQTYGQAPLIDASIQNQGGKLSIVDSAFRGTAEGRIAYNNLARHSLANLGVTAEMEIVRSVIAHNLSDTYPVLLNENGTLEFRDSTFNNNYSTGLEWRWNSPIHHSGLGEFLGSVEDFEPVLTQPAGLDANGDPIETLNVSSVKGFQGLTVPFSVHVAGESFQINSVDEVNQTVTASRINPTVYPTNTAIVHDDPNLDYRLDGLHVLGSVSPEDHLIQVANADPFLRFSLPMEIAVGAEQMTVLAIDTATDTLTVDRPFPQPIADLDRVTLYTENSEELLIGDIESYQHHSFPMDVMIAVYDEERNQYASTSNRYSLHQRLYPTDDWAPVLHSMTNPEVEISQTETRGGVTAVELSSVKPRVSAMEVVTVTGIDASRGVLSIERGRRGTVPIRFDQGAHLWALPGAMTVTNSTISDNAVLPHFYINGTADPEIENAYYHPEQAVLRSFVTDFAPSTTIENSTFTDSGSYGEVASVSAERTSMFAGDNPTRYANYDYRFHRPGVTGGAAAGWAENDFLRLGDAFIQDSLGVVIENSVLSGASVHNVSTGFGTGEISELPGSQRYQNFIETLTPDEQLHLERLTKWQAGQTDHETTTPEDPSTALSPLTTFQTRWIEEPSNIPNNLHIPRLGLLFVDDDNEATDTGFTSSSVGQTISTGLAGDAISFASETSPTEVTWSFNQVPAGVYEVAIPIDAGAATGFPVELNNDTSGGQLANFTFDARSRTLSAVDSTQTSITLSDTFRPGLRIQLGSEQLGVVSSTDNLDGTITYSVVRGADGTSAQTHASGSEVIAANKISFDPLTGQSWLILQDNLDIWDLIVDAQNPQDESLWQYLPADLTVKMVLPAGEGIADAVRLRQRSHKITPAVLEPLKNIDLSGTTSASQPAPHEDRTPLTVFTQSPTCNSNASVDYLGTSSEGSAWSVSDVPQGRHYLLASWPGDASNPKEVTNDSLRDHSWYVLQDFVSDGSDYEITLTGSPPAGVNPAVCVTHASNIIDLYESAYFRQQPLPAGNRYGFNSPPGTQQFRKIVDDSEATITGSTSIASATSSFAGSHTVLADGATAQWTFGDLTRGAYLISSSFAGDLPFSIYADGVLVSQGQLSADGTRSYSTRSLEFDFVTTDSPDGSFEESFRDDENHARQLNVDLQLGTSIAPYGPEVQEIEHSSSQLWIALDRVLADKELTVQIHGSAQGVPADAVRIERFSATDAMLASLSDHGDGLGGHRALAGSPILDQAHESLLFGINELITAPISGSYQDNRLYVQNSDRLIRSESNLDAPDYPFNVTIGTEILSVVGWDDLQSAFIVERGVRGTSPLDHPLHHPLNYGFAGQRINLSQPLDPTDSSALVETFHIPARKPFEVQLMDERILVNDVTDNFDGTYTLDLVRQARGTPGSPAVPATAELFLAVDQMGANRFVDGDHHGVVGLDLGAVESLSVQVSSTADLPDTNVGDGIIATAAGDITLRAAVMEANAFGGKAVIELDAGTYSLVAPDAQADPSTGDIDITGFVSIIGAGAASTTIDAGQLDRVFEIHPGGTLFLEGIQVSGGGGSSPGGGVYVSDGRFQAFDTVLTGNSGGDGGAIYAESSELILGRTSLVDNTATGSGGAVYLSRSSAVVKNATVSGNSASVDAGAFYVSDGATADLEFVTITNNQAPETSGIVSLGLTTVESSVIGGNTLVGAGSRDVAGRFSSGGHNFIGALGQHSTEIYDIDNDASTITVTDPSDLPQTPFQILTDGQVLTVSKVSANVLQIDEAFHFSPPPEWQPQPGGDPWHPEGIAIRYDGFWNQDVVDTSGSVLDPQLLPLDAETWSHSPDGLSPLIDVGPIAEGTIQLSDQRGSTRYVDTLDGDHLASDIGAFELVDYVSLTQTHVVRFEKGIGDTQFYDFEAIRNNADEELVVSYKVTGYGPDPAGVDDFLVGRMPDGKVVFAPGELKKTISIGVTGDNHYEYDEQFQLQISDLSQDLTLRHPTVNATILNDEAFIESMELTVSEPQNDDADLSGDYSVGDTLTYVFTLNNTGTVPQRFIELSAAKLLLDDSTLGYLLGGESAQFVGSYTLIQADLDNGTLTIDAELIAEYMITDPLKVSNTTIVALNPSLAAAFDAPVHTDSDGSNSYSIGDLLTFNIEITNDGGVGQTNVAVSTNLGGSLTSCPQLDPGQTCAETFTYQLTQSDLQGGALTLTADAVSDSITVPLSWDYTVLLGSGSGGSGSSGGGGSSGGSGSGSGGGSDPGNNNDGGSDNPDLSPPPESGTGEGNDQIVVWYHLGNQFTVSTCGESYAETGSDPMVCYPKSYDRSQKRNLHPPVTDVPPEDPTPEPIQWFTHETQTLPIRQQGSAGSIEDIEKSWQLGATVETYEVSHRGELTFDPYMSYSIPATVDLSGDFELEVKLQGPDGSWVESYSSVLDFYQDGSDADGTIDIDDPEEHHFVTVESVSVTADNRVVFEPQLPSVLLDPRKDANGNVYRYDMSRNVVTSLWVNFTDPLLTDVQIGTPLSSEVVIKDDLPVFRGDRMHRPGPTDAKLISEPVTVQLDSTARIDLNDLLFDPDGDPITIAGFSDGTEFAVNQRKFELGKTQSANVMESVTAFLPLLGDVAPYANQAPAQAIWQDSGTKYVTASYSGSTVQLHNELTIDDVDSSFASGSRWNPNSGSEVYYLDVLLAPSANAPVRVLQLEIDPVNERSSGLASSTVPTTQEWVTTVQPAPVYGADTDASVLSGTDQIVQVDAVDTGRNRSFERVGETPVDLVSGTFLAFHSLALDRSGGSSELALPGLIYDSSTVHIDGKQTPIVQAQVHLPGEMSINEPVKATLTWYDPYGQGDSAVSAGEEIVTSGTFDLDWSSGSNIVALSVGRAPVKSGLYNWKLDLQINGAVYTNSGQTPVVVNQGAEAVFGNGWSLEGVPEVTIDRQSADASSSISAQDRLILSFPGSEPMIFDYGRLAALTLPATIPGIQAGSKSTGTMRGGFEDVRTYGTMTARHDPFNYNHPEAQSSNLPDELVYTDPNGTEYVFYRHEVKATPTSTNRQSTYLLNRVEQAGIDFNPTTNPYEGDADFTGRRGLSFERDDDRQSDTYGRLDAIVASDGGRTEIKYDAAGYVDAIETQVDSHIRLVDLTVASGELKEVRQINQAPTDLSTISAPDSVRSFDYFDGRMTLDQWKDAGNAVVRNTEYSYSHSQPSSFIESGLASIQHGLQSTDPTLPGEEENQLDYEVVPAILASLQLTEGTRSASSLTPLSGAYRQKPSYAPISGSSVSPGDRLITGKTFSIDGLIQAAYQLIDTEAGDVWTLSDQSWQYDATSAVARHVDPIGRVTQYRYDYEVPPETVMPDGRTYDQSDYRGNPTHVIGPGLQQVSRYEVDDTKLDAVGKLIYSALESGNDRLLETEYEYANDGRLLGVTRGGNTIETLRYYPDFGQLQWHEDARGLRTDFTAYSYAKVAQSTTTDEYAFAGDGSVATTTTTQTTYDPFGFVDQVTTSVGSVVLSVTNFDHDRLGHLRRRSISESDGTVRFQESYEYAPDGRVTTVIDANGVRSESRFDQAGLLTRTIEAAGETFVPHFGPASQDIEQRTVYTYYGDGSTKSITSADGTLQEYFYDPRHYTSWERTHGIAGSSSIVAGTANLAQDETRIVKTVTDLLGRPVETLELRGGSVAGLTTTLEYADRRTDQPTQITHEYVTHDENWNVVKSTSTSNSLYDGLGNAIATTDSVGRTDSFKYDDLLRLKSTRAHAAYGAEFGFTYNAAGDLLAQQEIRLNPDSTTSTLTTTYNYDESGRQRRVTDPLVGSEAGTVDAAVRYAVDVDGLRVEQRSRTGEKTTVWLDAAGNPTREKNVFGGNTFFVYNQAGTLQSAHFIPADSSETIKERLTTFAYDALGRQRSQTVTDNTSVQSPKPSITTHTDYFLPTDTSVGWDVASTDGSGNTSAVIKDSIGQVVAMLQPSVGLATATSNDHPVTLVSYVDSSDGLFTDVQTTLTAGDWNSGGLLAADDSYPALFVTNRKIAPNGNVLRTSVELQGEDGVANFGETIVLSAFDALGRAVKTKNVDPIAGDKITTFVYDDLSSGTGKLDHATENGPALRKRDLEYDSAGNLVRAAVYEHAELKAREDWTYDAIGRPLSQSELVNELDANGDMTSTLVDRMRYWVYSGLSTDYHDRTGLVTTTTRSFAPLPQTIETNTHPQLGTFTATMLLNSDGSLQKADQTVSDLAASAPIYPSSSSVTLAYDAFGRQIRDLQETTVGSDAAPPVRIESAYYDSGALEKIVRKIAEDRVTETSFTVDGLGNTTSILDQVLTDTIAAPHWVNDDPGETRFIEMTYNINSSLRDITRHQGSDNTGGSRGYTNLSRYNDGRLAAINHRQDSTQNGPLLSASSRKLNPGGELSSRSYTVYDDALTAFIDETYDYQYSNQQLTNIEYTDVAAAAVPQDTAVEHDAHKNEIQGTIAGKAHRIYQQPLPGGGTRKFQYDLEGRVTQTKDIVSTSTGNVTITETTTVDNLWDHRGRLIRVDHSSETKTYVDGQLSSTETDSATSHHFYDALNRRIATEDSDSTFVKLTNIAYDPTGKAFEVVMNGGLNQIDRNYLNGPTGVLAVDQGDWQAADGVLPTVTAWAFADVDGTASKIASVDASGNWQGLQRRFARQGKVIQTSGATGTLLAAVPAIWKGMEFNEASELYLTATSGLGIDSAKVSYQPNSISFGDGWAQTSIMDSALDKYLGEESLTDPTSSAYSYRHYLTNPSEMDAPLKWGFYAATGTAVVSATIASGGAALGMTGSAAAVSVGSGIAIGGVFGGGAAAVRGENIFSGALIGAAGGAVGGLATHWIHGGRLAAAVGSGLVGGAAEGAVYGGLNGGVRGAVEGAITDGILGAATGGLIDRSMVGLLRGGQHVRRAVSRFDVAPNSADNTITMLRGMSHDEYYELVQSQTLVSHSMRAGTNVPNSLPRRLWHTFTSRTPPSPNVSTTRIPFVGNYFTRRSGGVVAQFEVPRSALQKSANVFEYEFLVQGGTRVSNIRLLNSNYRAGWRSYAAWGLESTGMTIGVGGAAFGVGTNGYDRLFGEQP